MHRERRALYLYLSVRLFEEYFYSMFWFRSVFVVALAGYSSDVKYFTLCCTFTYWIITFQVKLLPVSVYMGALISWSTCFLFLWYLWYQLVFYTGSNDSCDVGCCSQWLCMREKRFCLTLYVNTFSHRNGIMVSFLNLYLILWWSGNCCSCSASVKVSAKLWF